MLIREAYELVYPDTWKNRIDYKYLTDREADRQFEKSLDTDYENHRDANESLQ